MFNEIGNALAHAIWGNPQQRAMEQARQAELQRQQEQARQSEQARLAEEARLAGFRRRQEFQDAKVRMLGLMKGLPDSGFAGAANDLPVLRVKEVDDIFGTGSRTLKPAGTDEPGIAVAGMKLKEINFDQPIPPAGPAVETAESIAMHQGVREKG